jgi:hypothetical protein
MPALRFFIGKDFPYYPMNPIDYEGFPTIVGDLRYSKCTFEVLNSTSTSYPNSYVFGRTFLTKFNAAFQIDRTRPGQLSLKVSLQK